MKLSSTVSTCAMLFIALLGCSKSSSEKADKPEGSATGSATPPPVAVDASADPPETATVVGPTRSATGALELAGVITGTFEWKKKDQRSPITCVWDAAKEIGTARVDMSDGAGKLVTVAVDVPPTDVGLPRLEVSSKDLTATLKTSLGFNVSGVSGDDATTITVKFDSKLGDDEKKPDLTIKGTLEVSCPKKKS